MKRYVGWDACVAGQSFLPSVLPFNFVEHHFRGNVLLYFLQFVVHICLNTHLVCHLGNKSGEFGDLVFRQKAYLKIKISTPIGRGRHAVLRD